MNRRSGNMPRHGRDVRRRNRSRKPRYLVVCGGTVTERDCFTRLAKDHDLVIDVVAQVGSPRQLAEEAVRRKTDDARDTDADPYRKAFVVVDVDEFHDHAQAGRICNDNGILLIISNPCFEVWLVDHLESCPESHSTTKMVEQRAASRSITKGSRNKYIDFDVINGHLGDALRNADRHNTPERLKHRNVLTANREQSYAPWTDMPQLIYAMGIRPEP